MYSEWTTSLCNKWYTLTTQGSTMPECMHEAGAIMQTCPWMKKKLVLSSGVYYIYSQPPTGLYSNIGRDTHTLTHDVHHHHLSDRIRLYILERKEDYSIITWTTLQHGPSCTMYKDIIYCTVTPGRMIQKMVWSKRFLTLLYTRTQQSRNLM